MTMTRRTQQERRATTRAALIEATIASIRDDGYHATTTRHVAARAGVSLGGVAHHFRTRQELIAAAIDEVGQRVVVELRERITAIRAVGSRRTQAMLDALWEYFTGELFLVWIKVWIAAAEDAELHAALVPTERRLSTTIAETLTECRPPDADPRAWIRRCALALDTLRGLALSQTLEPRHPGTRDRWPDTKAELAAFLDP